MVAPLELVSIVCPAFQEEEVLPLFHKELCATLATLEGEYRFEIVYVDDGSKDRTLPVLKEMARADARIRYLSLSRNFGHQAALTAGLEHARGSAIISMDSDLQHPPTLLPQMLNAWRSGFEVVITIRDEDPRLSPFKRLTSRLFYQVLAFFSKVEVRIAASDFRLLSRKAMLSLLRLREEHRFVRGMVQWLGFPATEIPFMPNERRAGQSKYTLRRMLRLAGDGLFSFSILPLRLPIYLGVSVLTLGLAHSLWVIALLTLGWSSTPLSVHYLILLVHFVGGSLLCGVGILGEYVGRIYEQVKQRPLYLLKDASEEETLQLPGDNERDRREAA